MIDYEKLKLAHQLLSKITDKYYLSMYVRNGVEYSLCPGNEHESDMDFDSLDLLIAKLNELVQAKSSKPIPQQKYTQGQEVWSYTNGRINKWKLENIRWDAEAEDFRVDLSTQWGKGSLLESQLHATENELIESQIAYWCSKLKMQDEILFWANKKNAQNACEHSYVLVTDNPWCIKCGATYKEDECQHESDGGLHNKEFIDSAYPEFDYKCKKCGEFYR